MYCSLFVLMAATLISTTDPAIQEPDDSIRYEVTFCEDLPTKAMVRASMPYSQTLFISKYGAWSQSNGWGTFIDDLRVVDEQGLPLAVEDDERCTWSIETSKSPRINIEYTVDLSHATITDKDWPEGPKTTGAYWDGSSIFMLTGPLLIYSDAEAAVQLRFQVPENCQLVTPWLSRATPNEFLCGSIDEAKTNVIVVGRPDLVTVKTAKFTASVALLGDFKGKATLIGPAIEKYLRYYEEHFQEKNKHNYLIVMFPQSLETGEAYHDSYVHVSPEIPEESNRIIWSNIIAHELGHFWNGRQFKPTSWADGNWFSEGATEYASTLAMVRCGEISEEQFIDLIEKHIGNYILFKKGPPFDSVSLVEAGSNKSANNVALYNGGWAVCFCLDVLIREQTDNQKSFDDLLRELQASFGVTKKQYELGDLIVKANQVSGVSTGRFFERYVIKKETLPIDDFLQRAGFSCAIGATAAHVAIDPNARATSKRIRDGLLHGESSKLERAIDALFKSWNRSNSPGAAVAISRDNRILLQIGYGMADLEHQISIDDQTDFHAASVAKQFTAWSILLLEEEGKLAIDDPVTKYVPELEWVGDRITLRHLLHHTSGLRDQWQLLAISGVQPEDVVTQEQILRLVAKQNSLQFEPGEQQAYCNTGYSLLATIVERVSKRPFGEFTKERIFQPLGMNKTVFRESIRTFVPNRARSYRLDEPGIEQRELNYVTFGATSLLTTSDDMSKWVMHLLHLKRENSPFLNQMLRRGKLNNGEEINFGFGLFVNKFRGTQMIGHPGADAGFRSSVFVYPQLDLGVVILANVNNIDHWQLPNSIAENFILEPEESEADKTTEQTNDWSGLEGCYMTEGGMTIVIDKRYGDLCYSTSPEFKILPLEATGENLFKLEDSSDLIQFQLEKDKAITLTLKSGTHSVLASRRNSMNSAELTDLVADYRSVELDTTYSVRIHQGQLRFESLRNGIINLNEDAVDRFTSDAWYLPEIQFLRNTSGRPIGFEVRTNDENGIRFLRQ